MTGFVCYNSAGAMTINSDFTYPQRVENAATALPVGKPDYDGHTLVFGNINQLGYMTNLPDARLRWVRIPNGKWCFPGAWMYQYNAGFTMINTTMGQPITSGYLNVYAADGKTLVWSAVSAARMPRIIGYINLPPGANITSTPQTINMPENAFFLSNVCPGNFSDDPEAGATGYSGIVMKRISPTQIQYAWVQALQSDWKTLATGGCRIPFAIFPGI